jgi:hypothetical protein
VPLSDHEQRLLDQIERGLYAEDPKFAQSVQGADPRTHFKKRVAKAAMGFVLGVALLMAGVISKIIVVGVIGFVVMLACAVWGLSSWKRMAGLGGDASARSSDQPRPEPPRGKFMDRLEERWRRRREEGER